MPAVRYVDLGGEEWDYLVVLDACRYDYFASLYHRYLEGRLEERLSPGTDTWTWCRRALRGGFGDAVYLSGNPYINSRVSLRGCRAKEGFREVVDVWSYGWDEELGTVPPWTLTLEALRRLDSGYRLVVHYLQPHAPYLSPRYRASGFPRPAPGQRPVLKWARDYEPGAWQRLVRAAASGLWRLGLLRHHWPLLESLGLPPASPMDAVRRLYGVVGLREAYRENLEIVLGYVALLAKAILSRHRGARIIVTADHGELLGEDGRYGHGFDHVLVRRVPWLRVTGVRKVPAEAWRRVVPPMLRDRLRRRVDASA